MKLRHTLLSIATALLVFVSAPDVAAGQVIVGRVIDAASGDGVPEARVTVVGRDHRDARRALTAADGRFSVDLGGGGSYRVQVARAGYEQAWTRRLDVGPTDTVDVAVRMSTAAVRLNPLAVTARPRRLTVVGVFRDTAFVGGNGPATANGWRRSIVAQARNPAVRWARRACGAAGVVSCAGARGAFHFGVKGSG